jgi:hypothetical protein
MLPELSELLTYHHPKVIASYVRTYPGSEEKANTLFQDMLRFLWISRKHQSDRSLHPDDEQIQFQFVMHEEMREIDNMWHNFILYTHDYIAFCQRYFGEYLHHVPDVADTITSGVEEFSDDLEKYLLYTYDNLGEETVRRWFAMHLASTNVV